MLIFLHLYIRLSKKPGDLVYFFLLSAENDVFLHEIALNLTTQITHDEDVNQVQPNVLMNAVAWIEIDEDGISELKIHSLDITFEEYSSIILQSAIVMMIPLLLVWANQITIERKR